MSQEFPDNWKHLTNVVEELALQGQEAIQEKVSKAISGLQQKFDVGPTNSLPPLTAEVIVDKTPTLIGQSATPQVNISSFEADVEATAGAIVRTGAGQSFQDTGERHLFQSKLKFDAWITGEMVDYTKELGTKSDRWYRIAGKDHWVSAAVVHTNVDLGNQAVISNPSNSNVIQEDPFKGKIIVTQANTRTGAGTQFADVGDLFKDQIVELDGRVKGEWIDYRSTLGVASDEWLRLKGTHKLVSAVLVSIDLSEKRSDSVNQSNSANRDVQQAANLDLPVYKEANPFWLAGVGGPNCTWYANGRLKEMGYQASVVDKILGNAHEWDNQAISAGAIVSNEPLVGSIAVWESGRGGALELGHVAVVEQINADCSIVISESNWNGKIYGQRTVSPNTSVWADEFICVLQAKNSSATNSSKLTKMHKTNNSTENSDSQDSSRENRTANLVDTIQKAENNISSVETKVSDEKEFTFNEVLDKMKMIEETVPKKSKWWWKEGDDPYAVSNTLRRKGKDKYWKGSGGDGAPDSGASGNTFDWISGWNNRGADSYAKGESLAEFVRLDGDDRVVRLDNGMWLPVSHFFAALSVQFENLLIGVSPWDNTYAGNLGSVMGAMRNPSYWLGAHSKNYSDDKPITWKEAFSEKVGKDSNQLDGDVAAHVVAYLVKKKGDKISEALDTLSKMSRKDVFNIFTKYQFDYDLSQLQDKDTADEFKKDLKDKVYWFLRKSKFKAENQPESGAFTVEDDDLNKVVEHFLDYLTK